MLSAFCFGSSLHKFICTGQILLQICGQHDAKTTSSDQENSFVSKRACCVLVCANKHDDVSLVYLTHYMCPTYLIVPPL